MKFCVDCKYSCIDGKGWGRDNFYYVCSNPELLNPVTKKRVDCELLRTSGQSCGILAKYFEPK